MKKIFVFGSINMDLSIECSRIPAKGETLQGFAFLESPGGKGANQAASAAKTGASVSMLAQVGADRMGDAVVASLEKHGVNTGYIMREGAATGVAVIVRCDEDNRIICDYGANHEIDSAYVVGVLKENARPGDVLLTQLECARPDVFRTLEEAKKLGLVTLFNPAPAAKLPGELYKSLEYIVVNQTESELLTGIYPKTFDECRPALEYFRERGVAYPIITLGALGSICYADDYIVCPAVRVEVVDTTAAGDAYIGALASCLAAGKTLKDALEFATYAAALTITRLGAQQAVPTLEEVKAFMIRYPRA